MVSFSKTPVAFSPAGLTYVRSGRLAIARPGYSYHPRRHSAYRKTVVAADAPNAVRGDTTQTLEHQARSYLDINCGHCHNANGAADTSGLLLDYKIHLANAMSVCNPHIAAGRGSGGHSYSIVPRQPEDSILSFRLATKAPGMMMPELGRSLTHKEGLTLINRWIGSLEGQCLSPPVSGRYRCGFHPRWAATNPFPITLAF